jgi:hypothetical protein
MNRVGDIAVIGIINYIQPLIWIPEECSRKERNCASGCGLSWTWPELSAFRDILTMCVTIRFQELHGDFTYGLYTGPSHAHCTCIGNLSCKLTLSDPHCGVWVERLASSQNRMSLGSIYKHWSKPAGVIWDPNFGYIWLDLSFW